MRRLLDRVACNLGRAVKKAAKARQNREGEGGKKGGQIRAELMRKRVAGEKGPKIAGHERGSEKGRDDRKGKVMWKPERPIHEQIENFRPGNQPVKEKFTVLEVDILTDTQADAACVKDSGKPERIMRRIRNTPTDKTFYW